MEIPLYMLFPKIYSCPTVIHAKFSVNSFAFLMNYHIDWILDQHHCNICEWLSTHRKLPNKNLPMIKYVENSTNQALITQFYALI